MTLQFDKYGLATAAGDIRVFYFDQGTGEYTGWSDEFINIGVSMPGNSTSVDPGEEISGEVAIFNGKEWERKEDHRGETVYSITDGSTTAVDYIGEIKEGFTVTAPATQYDMWNGKKWVTDKDAKHAADVAATEQQKAELLSEAHEMISDWKAELELGIISDEDKASLVGWLAYIKELKAVDTSTAPEITWPNPPAA